MDRDERKKFLLELDHRLWFFERLIFITKKRRNKAGFVEFFHFLANLLFLTIGIGGFVKIINHPYALITIIAISASFIIGVVMLLVSTGDHFLLKDLTNSVRPKKKGKV